jgi:valyl-tRNA synthetase
MPETTEVNEALLNEFEFVEEFITAVRSIRNEKNIAQKIALQVYFTKSAEGSIIEKYSDIICKLCNLDTLEACENKVEKAIAKMVRTLEFFVPLTDNVNKEEEIKKIQADIQYYEGFKASVMKKLSNESFVSRAPEQVVAMERKKLSDAEQKIETLREQLKAFE